MATAKIETKELTEVVLRLSEEEAEALAAVLNDDYGVSFWDGRGELIEAVSFALNDEGFTGDGYYCERDEDDNVTVLRHVDDPDEEEDDYEGADADSDSDCDDEDCDDDGVGDETW